LTERRAPRFGFLQSAPLQEADYDDNQDYDQQEVNEVSYGWYGQPAEQPQEEENKNDCF
jgi:hypothetical protein